MPTPTPPRFVKELLLWSLEFIVIVAAIMVSVALEAGIQLFVLLRRMRNCLLSVME
jgi:hypothetical protein